MKNKIILMDIDGVVSPLGVVNESRKIIDIGWSKLVIPKHIESFVKDLSDKHKVIWSSSWEKDSLVLSKKCGFNINEYLDFTKNLSNNEWFKIQSITEFCSNHTNSNIMLLDDEIEVDEEKNYQTYTIYF